jgi:hypothetical protein
MSWLQELGFTQNPFYLEPVPIGENKIEKGFINRQQEINQINDFAQSEQGKLLLLGHTGEGKSSLLNVFECTSNKFNKIVLRVDIQKANSKEKFIEALLTEVQQKLNLIPKSNQQDLNKQLSELNIVKRKKGDEFKVGTELESKIGAVLASIRGKLSIEAKEKQEVEFYIAPRIQKLEGIFNYFLPVLFKPLKVTLICDNLEKLSEIDFERFIERIVHSLPSNVVFITTGDISRGTSKNLKNLYNAFDIIVMMNHLNTVEELRRFIDGRIVSYAINGVPKIAIDDSAIATLLDRANGNLRECFRYCFYALQKYRKSIDEPMISQAILDVDKPRFELLDDLDKKIMCTLATSHKIILKEISEELVDEASFSTIRDRLDNLSSIGLVKKKLEKKGRIYFWTYKLPKTAVTYFETL